ncbi:MAG: hypothetical protein ACREJM_11570, partial [Candidatus Saccharimonadales bacterium]
AEEGFDTLLRFSGRCDYFSVGGRWSGRLTLLRLRHEQPKVFDRFWKRLRRLNAVEPEEEAEALFRKAFPDFRAKLPLNREDTEFLGAPDDAQIMDRPLFDQLQAGFADDVDYSYEIDSPNVICTENDEDFKWPKTARQAANFWVVVIDYHH